MVEKVVMPWGFYEELMTGLVGTMEECGDRLRLERVEWAKEMVVRSVLEVKWQNAETN